MRSNKNERGAKMVNWIIFILMAVETLWLCFRTARYSERELSIIVCGCIISIIILRILSASERVHVLLHAVVTNAMMLVLAYVNGMTVGKVSVFQIASFVPLATLMLYLEAKVYTYVVIMLCVGYAGIYWFKFPAIAVKPDAGDNIIYITVVLLINLIIMSFVKMLSYQTRQSSEMEQSLDDLLKVVSAKCDEARAATKSKSAFLSSMSHEIRTPINAVLGMNELILQVTDDEEIIGYANNIESSGNLLLGLINDILDFSKIESGKMELVEVEYQVSSMLNDLITLSQPKAEAKGLAFMIDVDQDIPNTLFGDDLRVKQVITNLLSNAVKYTEEGEVRLKMTYEKQGDARCNVVFYVEDTGIGLKPEDIEKLYDSFSRFDNHKNRQVQGTGLGMAIVRQIVDLYQGDITVESTYGEGTSFCVSIPQKIVDERPMGDFMENYKQRHKSTAHKSSFIAPDAKILVVDDNKMNLQVVKGLLRSMQANVKLVMSGRECINCLEKEQYDLVLLDHMMPQMDGMQTLTEIKNRGIAKGTPILALTANAISGAKEMYLEHGFDDYLTKPISGEMLYKAVAKWVASDKLHEVETEDTKESLQEKQDKKTTEKVIPKQQARQNKEPDKAKNQADSWKQFFIKYVNMDQAMQYSIDGEKGVIANVQNFASAVVPVKELLTQAFENEQFDEYGKRVHALGSMANVVGMEPLYMMTSQLESACKSGNSENITKAHEKLMLYLNEIVSAIK